jgi:hypothetical protein
MLTILLQLEENKNKKLENGWKFIVANITAKWPADSKQQTVDKRQQTALETADSRQQTADKRQQAAESRHLP